MGAAVGLVLLLMVLASTLPAVRFREGLGNPVISLEQENFPLLQSTINFLALRYILWIMVLLALAYVLFTREGRKAIPSIVRQVGVALFWGGILYLLVQAGNPPEVQPVELTPQPTPMMLDLPEQEQPLDAPGEEPVYAPEPPLYLTRILSILFMAGVGLLVYRWWRRRPPRQEERAFDFDELALRANLAIDELRQGLKLDDVILRCYREMADTVATQRGLRRRRGETPREFEQDLARIGMPLRPVQRLTRLFEQVRYGGYQPVKRDQLEAIDSLTAIVEACTAQQARGSRRD